MKPPKNHGLTGTPEWQSWRAMRMRCLSPAHVAYQNYGGRGIRICQEWESFEQFLADMGVRPPGTTLDRVDNDGDYEPGNCRWTDRATQRHNSRSHAPPVLRGEDRPGAKLTALQVAAIRERYSGRWGEKAALAREFGMSESQVGRILRGLRWQSK